MPPAHVPTLLYLGRFPSNQAGCWQRVVDSPISGSWTMGQSTLSEVWDFNFGGLSGNPQQGGQLGQFEALGNFIDGFLGHSQSAGAQSGIFRLLPCQHPEIPYLYASRVDFVDGVGPIGISKGTTPTFKLLRVRLTYETPPYFVLGQGQIQHEWQRFCTFDIKPSTRRIQRIGGTWKWGAEMPDELKNQPVMKDNQSGMNVATTTITVNWYQVPDNGLFDGGFDSSTGSTNIEECVGTVNKTTFMGRPPGTMLMTGWHPVARTMPWMNFNTTKTSFARSWDVQLVWEYFNPFDFEGFDLSIYSLGDQLGHQALPHPTNGYWYRAYLANEKNPTIQYIYPAQDHNQVFLMNS